MDQWAWSLLYANNHPSRINEDQPNGNSTTPYKLELDVKMVKISWEDTKELCNHSYKIPTVLWKGVKRGCVGNLQ